MDNKQQSDNKFTNDDLKTMQSWDLDHKIAVSLTRIAEFYDKFPHKIYVSFSGGKDSTVLLHLVRRLYPDTPAVFVDTGLEYPELREFVKTVENVTWIRPEMNFRKVIGEYGYPIISKQEAAKIRKLRHGNLSERFRNYLLNGDERGKYGMLAKRWQPLIEADFDVSEKCCDIMKKKPAHKFQKETGLKPIIGTMAAESRMRKKAWLMHGCNIIDKKECASKPLSFWREQDILEYIKKYNLSYASVYGDIVQDENGEYYTTGCHRTGCVFCGFGCHLENEPNRFQQLKETHPKLWEYCMKSWDNGGLGMRKVLEFIGVKVD